MANERVRDPFDRVVRLAKGLLYRAVEADRASVGRVAPDLSLQSPGFVPANPATGRVYQGKFNQLFLRFSQAWGGDFHPPPPRWKTNRRTLIPPDGGPGTSNGNRWELR